MTIKVANTPTATLTDIIDSKLKEELAALTRNSEEPSEVEEPVEAQVEEASEETAEEIEEGEETQEEEIVEEEDKKAAYYLIYHPKCLTCGYLVSYIEDKFYNKCHFSEGNLDCPAKEMRIVVGVNIEAASDALAKALTTNDITRLERITTKLQDKDPVVIEQVFNMARKKMLRG